MGLDAGILGGLGAGGAAGGLAGMLMGRKKKGQAGAGQAQAQGQATLQQDQPQPMAPQDMGLMQLLQHMGNGGGVQGPGLLTNPQVPVGGVPAPDVQNMPLQDLAQFDQGQQPVLMDGGEMNVADQQQIQALHMPQQGSPFGGGGWMNRFKQRRTF